MQEPQAEGRRALILFAHGARDPQWAEPFRNIREQVLLLRPGLCVELAFLELMAPDLSRCVGDLAREGVRDMTLVPLFMAQGGHLRKDLPPMVRDLEHAFPGVRIEITPAIGESAPLLAAIAAWAAQQVR